MDKQEQQTAAQSPQTEASSQQFVAQAQPVQPESGIEAMRAITISRQYGSGGGEIGVRLAKRLGWHLIDHEIVAQVAQKLGITVQEATDRDEYAEGFLSRLFSNMQITAGSLPNPSPLIVPPGELQAAYHQALETTVEGAVREGHAIIIGRGGQVLLASRRDVLHVRIVAPLEQRIAYVALRENINQAEATARIKLKDRDREYYLRMQYHQQPNDSVLYDVTVNTAVLDLDSVVGLIVQALEAKARRLNVPAEELGPAAGLKPYRGHPADLRPPHETQQEAQGEAAK